MGKWWCIVEERWVDSAVHRDDVHGVSTQCYNGVLCNQNGLPESGIDIRTSESGLGTLRQAHLDSAPPTGVNLAPGWRDQIKFDFSKCMHVVETVEIIPAVKYVPSDRPDQAAEIVEVGEWHLAICIRCGNVNTRQCMHTKTEWQLGGRLLVCLCCGVDCT